MIIKNNKDINCAGIYKISNTITGKIYIGSSRNMLQRFKRHLNLLKNERHVNEYLQRSWDKHGKDAFTFEVMEIVEDIGQLVIVEQRYIDELKCCDKAIGYNIAPRADRPGELAEESRRKISEYRKANPWTKEQIEKSRKSRTGIPLTQLTIENIKMTLKNKWINMSYDDKISFSLKMKEVFNTAEHKERLRKQSDEINIKRMKISDEYILSEIALKYIACKSLILTASEFNMGKSALARIFKKINGEFPVLYRNLLLKINFDGDSITDLHKPEIQAKLTLHTRN
jgi:group I intron endonuclease